MDQNNDNNIDQIVASYAAIGRLHQRKRRNYAGIALVALPLLGFLTFQIVTREIRTIDSDQSAAGAPSVELETFKDQLLTEIQTINAQRNEFERDREKLLQQSTLLENELSDMVERRELLQSQNDEIAAERNRIAEAFAELESKKSEIEKRKAEIASEDPKLEIQRAELGRERNKLESERNKLESLRAKFAEESSLLEGEIKAINRERTELAAQRMVVQQRREELQKLIEKSRDLEPADADNINGERNASNPEGPVRKQDDLAEEKNVADRPYTGSDISISAHAESATVFTSPIDLPYVEAYELENMRGGFDLGDGMEISIGLTRSASINGEEQYSNYINLTDAMAGVPGTGASDAPVNLVQSGEGNFVSPDVLGAMTGSFATIIQNSLDNQEIALKNVYDISVQNVSDVVFDASATKAIHDAIQLNP